MFDSDVCMIRVMPRHDQVLIRLEVASETLGGIIMPTMKFDEYLRRGDVLAVGDEVTTLKVGEKVYLPLNAGAEVEHLYNERGSDKSKTGKLFLVVEKHLPAKIEYVEEVAGVPVIDTGVICGLTSEKQKRLQAEKIVAYEKDKVSKKISLN